MALQHLRSSTAHKRPIPTVMSAGQIAINTNEASPGLFFKDSNGDLVKVGPVHIGENAPNSSPASTAATALVTGTVYQILTVGTSDFTLVGASANTVGTIFTATGTTTGTGTVSGQQGVEKGEQWLDTTGGTYVLKIYDGSAWRSESGTFVDVNGDTMTGALLLDNAASASAPDLSFDGDADTGIYSPGANQVAISTNGTAAVTVDASQRVGIGTASPATKLEITHGNELGLLTSGPYNFQAKFESTDSEAAIIIEDSNSTNDGNRIGVIGDNMAFTTANSERLRITSDGKVGIGTSSPSVLLHVNESTGAHANLILENSEGSAKLGTNSNIFYVESSQHIFYNSGGSTEYARIDSSGRVGIGTTSPMQDLQVGDFSGSNGIAIAASPANYSFIYFADGNSGTEQYRGYFQYSHADDALEIATAGTERMRVDSSGRLLVGTTISPSAGSGQYANLVVQGYPGVATGDAILSLQRGQTANQVASGNALGSIVFGYSNGTAAASITGRQDGAGGTNDYPGRLVFSTTADGASSPTSRVVINSAGTTIFGTNRTSWAFNADNTQITASGAFLKGTSGTGSTTHCAFYNPNGQVGGIVTSGSSTAYNTSSDYRLKENVVDITDGIARVKLLQPKRFNFIADADITVDGFLAHEAQTVVPEAVVGTKDQVDEDGNPVMQGIDQSKLVPLLTAALQEAIAKIETLETEVAALKAS